MGDDFREQFAVREVLRPDPAPIELRNVVVGDRAKPGADSWGKPPVR